MVLVVGRGGGVVLVVGRGGGVVLVVGQGSDPLTDAGFRKT